MIRACLALLLVCLTRIALAVAGSPELTFFLVAGGIGLILLVIVGGVYWRRRGQVKPVSYERDIQIEVVDDGFWMTSKQVQVRAQVRYRCRVAGESRIGRFPFEPGPAGYFVRTGSRPSEIEILEIHEGHAERTTLLPRVEEPEFESPPTEPPRAEGGGSSTGLPPAH